MKEPQDVIQILQDLPEPFFDHVQNCHASRVVKVGVFMSTIHEQFELAHDTDSASSGIIHWWTHDGLNGWRYAQQAYRTASPFPNEYTVPTDAEKAIFGITKNHEPIIDLNVVEPDTKMILLDSEDSVISQHTKADIGRIVILARAQHPTVIASHLDPRTATVQHSSATWGR